ncbi:protein OCTOPUS-like [Magnolia sinica]|uniref:protein OCTOPUS-like n=1 Tax=Magnolia sinica TaxID=86752 RepID=UPI002659F74C|nr:protein OCTOPUS-like [Magnolia sinica]
MTLEHPPPRPRPSSSCQLHPDQNVTGFCASCLRERLTQLAPAAASDHKPTSTSALNSFFKKTAKPSASDSNVLPQLRRSKSFSGIKHSDGISVIFEPQRRSCDVRAQSTLANLFYQENVGRDDGRIVNSRIGGVEEEIEEIVEIRAASAVDLRAIGEEEATMKDHIDLDGQMKNPTADKAPSAIAGSFRAAAAVFGKKLQKWRGKKKGGAHGGDRSAAGMVARDEKPRRFLDTQSEVADYGFGRRSCDTGPRFSLDAGRVSFDDPRCSFDGPRASWDGYLMGRVGLPRMAPTMGSVVEDGPVVIGRSDDKILSEMNSIDEDPKTPGGSVQTREYYSNSPSWQRRRRSFERSSSMRKVGAVSAASKTDETRSVSSAKLSPPRMDYFHRNKIADSRDLHSNSLRDDCSEIFESASRDVAASGRKGSKKSGRWSKAWNIWGLINRRGSGSKDDDGDDDDGGLHCRANVVERSRSESWRREANVEQKMAFDPKAFRSNSSVSWRSSSNIGGFENVRRVSETNGHGKKRREEPMLERARSARYSPSKFDNGLLRFYLAPLSSSRRSSRSEKSGSKNSHLFTRNVLRMY